MQSAVSRPTPCPLIKKPDPADFTSGIDRLSRLFKVYAENSPEPLPSPGLIITPEIRYHCELYLPIAEIRRHFCRLFSRSLTYQPLLSSTPFHNSRSWADCFVKLPIPLQILRSPAVMLKRLLHDEQLLENFIFNSFIPARFNGAGFDRYPEQLTQLRENLLKWRREGRSSLRCLDAACGTGEGSWQLAELLDETGWMPEESEIEGWTVDPLEVWAAEHCCLPHDRERTTSYGLRIKHLTEKGWGERISFSAVNLLEDISAKGQFDLIICNGLLGGPIINQETEIIKITAGLSSLLAPAGQILVASRFHDGWKKRISDSKIKELITAMAGMND